MLHNHIWFKHVTIKLPQCLHTSTYHHAMKWQCLIQMCVTSLHFFGNEPYKCSILPPCNTFTFTCHIKILSTYSTMQKLLKNLILTLMVMKFHYCNKKCLQLDRIQNQKNPVQILTLFLCDQVQHYPPGNVQALTVLSFLLMLLCILIISHICTLCPIHLIVLDVATNNIK